VKDEHEKGPANFTAAIENIEDLDEDNLLDLKE
jgi:hypothetical protein